MSGLNDPRHSGEGHSSDNREPVRIQRVDTPNGRPESGGQPGSGFRRTRERTRARTRRRLTATLGWVGAGVFCLTLVLAGIRPGGVLGLMRPATASSQAALLPATASATARPATQAASAPAVTVAAIPTATAPAATAPTTGAPTTAKPAATPTARPTPVPTKTEPTETVNLDLLARGEEKPSGLSPLAECCGGKPAAPPVTRQKSIQAAKIVNGRQQATITLDSYGYSPKILVVQQGVSTTLGFDMKRPDSCNDQLWFSLLDRKVNLAAGEKVPAFKPTDDFAFSCWMGMRGVYVKVVKDLDNIDLDLIELEVAREFTDGNVDCH